MSTITEDYVSFEVAKLLKENGFDEVCVGFYTPQKELHFTFLEETNSMWLDDSISAPTIQMVLKWLREVYKLHITVVPAPFNFEHQDIQDGWSCEVTHLSDLSYEGDYEFFQKKYSTYEEAAEAAIKYCLENLI